MIQSDESTQCRARLVNELVLSGEMSSKISKLEKLCEAAKFSFTCVDGHVSIVRKSGMAMKVASWKEGKKRTPCFPSWQVKDVTEMIQQIQMTGTKP